MNENTKPTKKCNLVIPLIGIGILGLLIGYLVGAALSPGQPEPALNKEQIVQQTKEVIKNRFVESGMMPSFPEEIYVLADARIEEVGENYLLVTPSPRQDPFELLFPEKIKILFDENTEVKMVSHKNREEYIEEIKSYEKNPEEFTKIPDAYIREDAETKDIMPGYYVYDAYAEKNIKGMGEFLTTKLYFSVEKIY